MYRDAPSLGLGLGLSLRQYGAGFSDAARDYFARLDAAGLRVTAYDAANARLIDRLVANGGNFWPASGAFNAMAGYLYPGNGANLIPLKDGHDAGTLNAFVTGDWNAVTGLKGDGSTKYVDSNRNNNADGQNDQSMGVMQTTADTSGGFTVYLGAGVAEVGANLVGRSGADLGSFRSRNQTLDSSVASIGAGAKYIGITRSEAANFKARINSSEETYTRASEVPLNTNVLVFRRGVSSPFYSNARLPFYHIGPNLNGAGEQAELSSILTDWQTDLANA